MESRSDLKDRRVADMAIGALAKEVTQDRGVPVQTLVERILAFAVAQLVRDLGTDRARLAMVAMVSEIEAGTFDDFDQRHARH